MQIASNDTVFILDLIKLSEDAPDDLDKCLAHILHSPSILKLGKTDASFLLLVDRDYGIVQCESKYFPCSFLQVEKRKIAPRFFSIINPFCNRFWHIIDNMFSVSLFPVCPSMDGRNLK